MTGVEPAVSGVRERREVNRRAWDLRTGVHVGSAFYDVAGFRRGRCTLNPVELALVGDVAGVDLAHSQCHIGVDTLSWARRGARVTGIDFSEAAIEAATGLAADCGIPARFVRADVQDLPAGLGPFTVVVSTYGVIPWLDDLAAWAAGVHGLLRPGGRFVLVEFHPVLEVVAPGAVSGAGGYFGVATPPRTVTSGTYTDRAAPITYAEYRWQHPISAVVTALLGAGLRITAFGEHARCPFDLLPGMTADGTLPGVPTLYSIIAWRDE